MLVCLAVACGAPQRAQQLSLETASSDAPEAACWDGGGALFDARSEVAPLTLQQLAGGYPGVVHFLSDAERQRRARLLEERNPTFLVQVDAFGAMERVVSRRMPCETERVLREGGTIGAASSANTDFFRAFAARNPDVIPDARYLSVEAARLVDGEPMWTLACGSVPGSRERMRAELGGTELSDAELVAKWAGATVVLRSQPIPPDRCADCPGPDHMPSSQVLASAALSLANSSVVREVMLFEIVNGFEVRRVAHVAGRRDALVAAAPRPADYAATQALADAVVEVVGGPQQVDAVTGEDLAAALTRSHAALPPPIAR